MKRQHDNVAVGVDGAGKKKDGGNALLLEGLIKSRQLSGNKHHLLVVI